MDYRTPYQALKVELPEVNDDIRFVIPILLDRACPERSEGVAVALGPWSGYHVLAQHLLMFGRLKASHSSYALPAEACGAGLLLVGG